MGLLDDAIREHLELKRRRGADPAEVEKQEREALGPVRSGTEVAEPAPGDAAEPVDGAVEPPLPAQVPEPSGAVRAPDPEPEPEPPEPSAPVAASLPEDPPPVGQPTQQYAVEDLEELRADSEPSPPEGVVPADDEEAFAPADGEDVLDETPDFLQEAPEHDRLWFEQRPPRDFDF